MNIAEQLKLIREVNEEFKAASSPLVHPHFDGVTQVILDRVRRGEGVDGQSK